MVHPVPPSSKAGETRAPRYERVIKTRSQNPSVIDRSKGEDCTNALLENALNALEEISFLRRRNKELEYENELLVTECRRTDTENEKLGTKKQKLKREYAELKEANEDLLKKKRKLKIEKIAIEAYARRLACPLKIRCVLENFATRFLLRAEKNTTRQAVIHAKLVEIINPEKRITALSDCVRQLLHLAFKSDDKINSTFLKPWDLLHNIPQGLHPADLGIVRNDLSKTVMEMFEAEDPVKACHIFVRTKVEVWQRRNKMLSHDDIQEIKGLCRIPEDVLRRILEKKISLTMRETEYVHDILKVGKMFEGTTTSLCYKRILWVLYTSEDPVITQIVRQLEAKWPNLTREEQRDLYATECSHVFKVILCTYDRHRPEFHPPYTSCNPTIEDYREYIRLLATNQSTNWTFVAETLCTP